MRLGNELENVDRLGLGLGLGGIDLERDLRRDSGVGVSGVLRLRSPAESESCGVAGPAESWTPGLRSLGDLG